MDRSGNKAVMVTLWEPSRPPEGFGELWRQELTSLSELAALRARLRTSLTGTPTVVDPEQDHWSERMVLVADELTSNALRHGGSPVATALSQADDHWMVTVSDPSVDVPPEPAVGRDPGRGGFGLYLVADLSSQHGWCSLDDVKTVWAVLPATDDA
jgi:signal transduction histidine kinase